MQNNELIFNEEEHKYTLNNNVIPSVTQSLSMISNLFYAGISDNVLENAKEKGTAVHRTIEFFNKYKFGQINEEYKGYFEAYKNWHKTIEDDIKEIQSEVRVYNKLLHYAGTADMVVKLKNDKNILIDIKTTNQLQKKYISLQLSAYKEALNSNDIIIDKMYVLWLHNDGTYDYIEIENKFDLFLYSLTLYNYFKE